jgi:TolB-like protein
MLLISVPLWQCTTRRRRRAGRVKPSGLLLRSTHGVHLWLFSIDLRTYSDYFLVQD